MKKRVIALILAGMLLATGCGQSKNTKSSDTAAKKASADASVTTEDYKASDYVTLGKYKGVSVTLTKDYSDDDAAVKDYEETLVDEAGGNYTEDKSQKTVKEDSIVNVDYKGIKDGEAFEGGTATNQTIDVKNNQDATQGTGYIEGFTDGLVGAKVGETVSSKVTFPENYGSAELAGQEVTFEFKVNYICKKISPDDVSDDFLKKNFSVDSKDAFFDYAKKKLQEKNKSDKDSESRTLVEEAIENSSKVNSYPKGLIDRRMANYRAQYKKQYFTEGMTWKDFYKQYNVTEKDFNDQVKKVVRQNIKTELVFSAIAEKENITLDESGFNTYVKNLMSSNRDSTEKDFYLRYGSSESEGKNYIETIYLVNQALSYCVENATINPKS
ncbi:MAG: FKBP-type peptidyl-prolyl cis-trans isomerase [Lachnospiraceae bacterium]|nr:FKBP-type peptidyl-prolyl cis-trans isomerase [Lachnospiraceae bacterium]